VGRGYVETERRRFDARVIVVAAGVWTSHILPVPGLVGKMGAAVLHPNVQIQEPFIRPWAPYKQLVAFNLGDDMWVGDGSAIKPENWTPERQAKTVARCSVTGGLDIHGATVDTDVLEESKRVLVGTRPYVPKKHLNGRPCYLEEREPGLWVATGGAKNGTIAAGWCAHEIGKAVQ
jgi:glycine/D-amino acid oxidase-like deaminating enzyme